MTPKVSILVPVYQVSAYIERCARSLFGQTLEEVEFVFVNDATPDDSMEKLQQVLNDFPHRRNEVKIVNHDRNRGLAAARNSAIAVASGEYILTVDSDDYIDPEMAEVMYAAAKNAPADIVICNFLLHTTTGKYIFDSQLSITSNLFDAMIKDGNFEGYLCTKLIRRELFVQNNIKTPEGLNYLEDLYVSFRLFYYTNKIIKIDRAFYHYNKTNRTSITHRKGEMHFENVERFWNLTDDFLRQKGMLDTYRIYIDKAKAKAKVHLLVDTGSLTARKKYRLLFAEEERHHFSSFRRGAKIMSRLVRYRLFVAAQVFHYLLFVKNKFSERLSCLIR
jgi:glycosyltransferase involved in cell wall biosynthesis